MMLRLGFTGDVCLGGQLRELIALHGPEFPFTGAAPALRAVDLLVGNLECCLIRDSTGPEARRFMAVPAAHADGLRAAGFHTMSLANNHMMDCGTDGLTATLARLGDLGIGAFGAGPDLPHAEQPLVLERGGRRVALLAAAGSPTRTPATAGWARRRWTARDSASASGPRERSPTSSSSRFTPTSSSAATRRRGVCGSLAGWSIKGRPSSSSITRTSARESSGTGTV